MAEEEPKSEELEVKDPVEAPEAPPAEKPDPVQRLEQQVHAKDAKIGGMRREIREVQQQFDDFKAANAKPPEKSPIELAKEAADADGELLEFTPELYNKQRQFENKQQQAESSKRLTRHRGRPIMMA